MQWTGACKAAAVSKRQRPKAAASKPLRRCQSLKCDHAARLRGRLDCCRCRTSRLSLLQPARLRSAAELSATLVTSCQIWGRTAPVKLPRLWCGHWPSARACRIAASSSSSMLVLHQISHCSKGTQCMELMPHEAASTRRPPLGVRLGCSSAGRAAALSTRRATDGPAWKGSCPRPERGVIPGQSSKSRAMRRSRRR